MSLQYKSGFCLDCNLQRKCERDGVNHILHLLLSIITMGVWVIVWFASSIKIGGWRCSFCGGKNIKTRKPDNHDLDRDSLQARPKLTENSLTLSKGGKIAVFVWALFLLGYVVVSAYRTYQHAM